MQIHAAYPARPAEGGLSYSLPRGRVPIVVFADSNGIGITIEPAVAVADGAIGPLIASIRPSLFNNEKFKLTADDATGFLKTVSTDSEPQSAEIVKEAARTAGRLALQNSRAEVFKERVVALEDGFDPLSELDRARIEGAIGATVARLARSYPTQRPDVRMSVDQDIKITVHQADGSPAAPAPAPALDQCQLGVCARAMTTRLIRVSANGATLGSKLVAIPSPEVVAVPVPVPQTILAKQKVKITMIGGIVNAYEIDREADLLGLVKIPGAVIGGLAAGLTEQLDFDKSVADKQKALAESEDALAKVLDKRVGTLKLQNAEMGTTGAYTAAALTVYPLSVPLTDAIQRRIDAASAAAAQPGPGKGVAGADLLTPVPPKPGG